MKTQYISRNRQNKYLTKIFIFPILLFCLIIMAGCWGGALPNANTTANKPDGTPQLTNSNQSKNIGGNKMDGIVLQLSMDVDKWTGKENPKIDPTTTLKYIWDKAKKGKDFVPYGQNSLVNHLQTISEFSKLKDNHAVINLQPSDFDERFKTFGDLAKHLRENTTTDNSKNELVKVNAVVSGIQRWLGDEKTKQVEFVTGSGLDELWTQGTEDYKTNGIANLVSTFKNDEFFGKCSKVEQSLNANTFKEVETVGSLYEYLKPCPGSK